MIACGRCNRPLKDPKSVERGYGPDCWATIQAEATRTTNRNGAEKSDFTYRINTSQGKPVLVITDLDRGGMSVTNNIEAIVQSIAAEIGERVYTMPIVYRDSMGRYDGVNGDSLQRNPFYFLDKDNEAGAVIAAIQRQEEQICGTSH